ncbi:MAG: MATE family efflux transporter [Peptococcaceae bacterium]|nr:MATE family efflux transporter [Peptococcaceae bacterium]
MSQVRAELLKEKPFRLMIKLCVPAIIGMLVVGLYSFMDAVFVGQLIGENAMGAVSVAYPFTLINNGIATLVGIGSASILSRAIGEKDYDTVDKIMGNLLVLILALSLIVSIIGVIFTRQILSISGAGGEILNLAERYLKIVYLGSAFVNFAQSANMVMRGEGLLKKAMVFMGIGAVINIVLDPILIILMGERGIEGAAIATVTAQIIQAMVTIVYFIKKSKTVRIHRIRLEMSFLPQIFSVGVSAMLMQVMSMVQQTILYNTAAAYGSDTQIILMGAALRIQAFSFIPLWGMSQGLQPVVGTNYGAKLFDRVKKTTNVFILGAVVLALLFWFPIQLTPKAVLSLFIKDASIVASGVGDFRLMYSIFPALGIMIMGLTFFQAIGKGNKASVLVLLRQLVLFIPLTLLLPKTMGIVGVWAASPLTDGLVLILTITFLALEYRHMNCTEKESLT